MSATTVWVVRSELCFSENGDVAWINGIFATEEAAEEAAQVLRQDERDGGRRRVYELLDEDDAEDWDISIMVEQHALQGV